jgi:ribosomal protein L32
MKFIKVANTCECTHMESCYYNKTKQPQSCNCSDGTCYNCGEAFEYTKLPHQVCMVCGQFKNCINTDAGNEGETKEGDSNNEKVEVKSD